jgi:DNA modification methylase
VAITVLEGDSRTVLAALPYASVQCCVTSPPYFGLRDYGHDGQMGLESTPDAYVAEMVALFREVRRVLKDDGTLWLNLGDSYARTPAKGATGTPNGRNVSGMGDSGGAGIPDCSKEKDLLGIPWRVAFALQQPDAVCPFCEAVEHVSEWTRGPAARYTHARCPSCEEWSVPALVDGWYLRSDIIWHKPNPMPESVTDRPTKAHEYVFLLTKSARYFYDADAIAEEVQSDRAPSRKAKRTGAGHSALRPNGSAYDGEGTHRNARTVWSIASQPFKGAHFATMPPELARRCILAGSRVGDTVLDPFGGAGTTGLVADRLGRDATLIELNPTYAALARARIAGDAPLFAEVA